MAVQCSEAGEAGPRYTKRTHADAGRRERFWAKPGRRQSRSGVQGLSLNVRPAHNGTYACL